MFDQKDIDWLKPEDGAVVNTCRQHHWVELDKWHSCAKQNIDQRWRIKKERCMEGVALDTPSSEELVLLASWKELSDTQHPTSCFVCNWLAVQSSSSTGESRRRAARDIAEQENSPFLLAIWVKSREQMIYEFSSIQISWFAFPIRYHGSQTPSLTTLSATIVGPLPTRNSPSSRK